MTRDDLMDMLPKTFYMSGGTLMFCTYHERLMKKMGIDVDLLLSCIEDCIYDEEIDYSAAVDEYFEEKETTGE